MRWEKGKERFTNLYVASEIGPFAASISKGDFKLEHRNKRRLISKISNQIGKLFVSRMGDSRAIINIDIGDIITVKNSEGLPQIDGNIIRSSFQLKYKVKLSDKVELPYKYEILAGDFFFLNDLIINQPRNLLNCLKVSCKLETDALLLICPTQAELHQALINKSIKVKFIEDQPVDFLATREEVLKKVREGQIPKGILKKWPLYVISSS
jgi:hypothetical protein